MTKQSQLYSAMRKVESNKLTKEIFMLAVTEIGLLYFVAQCVRYLITHGRI